jgi:hypothetical protein
MLEYIINSFKHRCATDIVETTQETAVRPNK